MAAILNLRFPGSLLALTCMLLFSCKKETSPGVMPQFKATASDTGAKFTMFQGQVSGQPCILASDGNLLICGSRYGTKSFIMKVAPTGKVYWNKEYDNYHCSLTGIVEADNKDLLICGWGIYTATFVMRTTASGGFIWQKTYNYNSGENFPYSLIKDQDGNLVVSTNDSDYGLMKINNFGDTVWTRGSSTVPTYFESYPTGRIFQASNGDYIITGTPTNTTSPRGCFLIRTDASGHIKWLRHYDPARFGQNCDAIELSDGHLLLCTQTHQPYGNHGYFFIGPLLELINANGDTLLTKRLSQDLPIQPKAIRPNKDGTFTILGLRMGTHICIVVMKVDLNGYILFSKTITDGLSDFRWASLVKGPNDENFVIGNIDGSSFFMSVIDKDGNFK